MLRCNCGTRHELYGNWPSLKAELNTCATKPVCRRSNCAAFKQPLSLPLSRCQPSPSLRSCCTLISYSICLFHSYSALQAAARATLRIRLSVSTRRRHESPLSTPLSRSASTSTSASSEPRLLFLLWSRFAVFARVLRLSVATALSDGRLAIFPPSRLKV